MGLTSAIKGCNQVTDQQVKNSGVQELQNETAAFRSVNGDYLASIAGDRDRQAKLESRLLDKLSRMEGSSPRLLAGTVQGHFTSDRVAPEFVETSSVTSP
jgi:hypothetical protein